MPKMQRPIVKFGCNSRRSRTLTPLGNAAYFSGSMKKTLVMLVSLALAATGFAKERREPPTQLDKANVLPLALDDAFQFRKTKIFLNEPELYKPTTDQMVSFE